MQFLRISPDPQTTFREISYQVVFFNTVLFLYIVKIRYFGSILDFENNFYIGITTFFSSTSSRGNPSGCLLVCVPSLFSSFFSLRHRVLAPPSSTRFPLAAVGHRWECCFFCSSFFVCIFLQYFR